MHAKVVVEMSNARGGGCSDHACLAYTTRSGRDAAAVEWLLEGARLGQRLFVVTHDDDGGAGLLSALASASDHELVRDVACAGIDQLYDLSVPIDLATQLSRYADEVARAVADGFSGLRVFCDITTLIADAERRRSHGRWEHAADVWMAAGNPLAPLCAYDVGVLGADALPVMALHPLRRGPASAVTPFGLYGGSRRPILDGEVDAFAAPVLAEALTALPPGPVDIDVSELSLLGARGAVAIARACERESDPVTLRLFDAPHGVRRVWKVLGLDADMLRQPSDLDASACS
ncbi:MEDS domain-containing protein [Mycobacterium sp. Marseille-P9652]|uniref:MEDS domain-containing protein n=1 Tax=Mycobacterium sp. Marseille-P9652 TaxID=2654950 RepID=UPI001E39664D|nr:MEDS domain-containing protein [Mycobacterium sp. Marseille-P9652]